MSYAFSNGRGILNLIFVSLIPSPTFIVFYSINLFTSKIITIYALEHKITYYRL